MAQRLASKRNDSSSLATLLKIKIIFAHSFELGSKWDAVDPEEPGTCCTSKAVNKARERYIAAETRRGFSQRRRPVTSNCRSAIVSLLLLTAIRVLELLSDG